MIFSVLVPRNYVEVGRGFSAILCQLNAKFLCWSVLGRFTETKVLFYYHLVASWCHGIMLKWIEDAHFGENTALPPCSSAISLPRDYVQVSCGASFTRHDSFAITCSILVIIRAVYVSFGASFRSNYCFAAILWRRLGDKGLSSITCRFSLFTTVLLTWHSFFIVLWSFHTTLFFVFF